MTHVRYTQHHTHTHTYIYTQLPVLFFHAVQNRDPRTHLYVRTCLVIHTHTLSLSVSHLIFSRLQDRTLREEHGSIVERDFEPETSLLQVIVLL